MREIKKFLETNDNENTTNQNLWDAGKAVLRGQTIANKFIYYLNLKKKNPKTLTLYLKGLEKVIRRKEGNNQDQSGNT